MRAMIRDMSDDTIIFDSLGNRDDVVNDLLDEIDGLINMIPSMDDTSNPAVSRWIVTVSL